MDVLRSYLTQAREAANLFKSEGIEPDINMIPNDKNAFSIWQNVFSSVSLRIYKNICLREISISAKKWLKAVEESNEENKNNLIDTIGDLVIAHIEKYQTDPPALSSYNLFKIHYCYATYGNTVAEVQARIDYLKDLRQSVFQIWFNTFKPYRSEFLKAIDNAIIFHGNYFPEGAKEIKDMVTSIVK